MDLNKDSLFRSRSAAGFRSAPHTVRKQNNSDIFARTQPNTVKQNIKIQDSGAITQTIKEVPERPKTSYAFRPRECFFNGTFSNFGKDAPKIAIGCSRQEPPVPPDTPGPGHYDIPPIRDSPKKATIPRCVKFPDPVSVTANVDLFDTRTFPQVKPFSIAPKTGKSYYDFIDTPGPSFVPPSTLSPKTHKIASRYETKTSAYFTPGPGTYNPQRADLERAPVYSMQGIKNRDDWLKDPSNRPGPGEYSPDILKLRKSEPKWSFGSKSRRGKQSQAPIPIGQFLFKVDSSLDRDAWYSYISRKPQLRDLIDELLYDIIYNKPDDPVGFIRAKFASMKKVRQENPHPDISMDFVDLAELLK